MDKSILKFNIARRLDTETLQRKIREWLDCHTYDPIILLSPDTLNDMPVAILKPHNKNYDRYITMYAGCKIFTDPTMQYGEVELR